LVPVTMMSPVALGAAGVILSAATSTAVVGG
jgi:hypothetical protein